MKSSFLIQMIRWIRGSSRIEFFIFLITWGIFFEWWELYLQLLPYYSSLLMSWAESNYFLLEYILCMNESHDPGRPFKVAITTSTFSTSSSTASRDPCKVWLYGLCILDLHILQQFSQSHIPIYALLFKYIGQRNQTYLVSLGKTLVA